MKEVYVLAIGGSGARILRSLVMLLAAGVETGAKIVPIIIDPDEGAGNLSETIQLLELYQRIREKAIDGQVEDLITFSTPIEKVSGADYLVKLNNVAGEKFREYVGESLGMSQASQGLLSSLFSRNNLELDMTIGFKGNPNIGSIVLGQFEENKTYEDFLKDLQNGDSSQKSIFIISSIFGGTGASGFPTLLKSLRSHQTVVRDMRIGALSLLPYFSLQNNEDSAIDSATFYAKTRAALSYYMSNIIGNNNVDDFYLLGDKTPNSYDNHDGGKAQRNIAHFVELAGAMSIVHFARQEAARPQPVKAQMYEYGINGGNQGSSIGFKNLGDQMEKELATPLTAFYLMRRFLENTDVSKDLDPWLKSIQPTLDGAFIDDLEEFLIQYEQWLGELGAHRSHGFVPLSLDQSIDDLFNCVPEYKVEKKSFFSKLTGAKENIALYRNTLNSLSKEQGAPTTEGGLLNMLSDASYDLCRDEIKLP